jgi:hypothetical protein
LVAMVQFATQVRVMNLDPRTARFRYPWRSFLSKFFYSGQSSDVVSCATVNCFLILPFHRFLFAFFLFVVSLG